eukprot:TRINITY_DN289_c0_g3_i1.p3 TRINITY_DN289_c0_g3~~TRINITY_DN289_c0_g3_i1.p3  ORF type:complete len:242 (+),score=92.99 TRINITY_DN289_c0_g3_i1:49-774(+)
MPPTPATGSIHPGYVTSSFNKDRPHDALVDRSMSAMQRGGGALDMSEVVPSASFAKSEAKQPAKSAWRRLQDGMLEQSGKMWFPVFVAFLYFMDTFVLVMPNDVFIVAAVAANKKRWFVVALLLTAACALACIVVYLIAMYDPDWLRKQFPSVFASSGWKTAEDVFEKHGVAASFALVTVLPIHPFLLVGALSRVPMIPLVTAITAGRFLRNTLVCYATAFFGEKGLQGALQALWGGGKKD